MLTKTVSQLRIPFQQSIVKATATAFRSHQFDTDKYPANTTGTFNGTNTTINFVYKALDSTSSVVHYYNSNNWSNVRCYAYTDGGEEPNGKWNNATVMTSEGNGWLNAQFLHQAHM